MKIGIMCSLYDGCLIDKDIKYIGVDHGIEHLQKLNIKPIIGIGDFDSLEDKHSLSSLNIKTLPTIKDDTDCHSAIKYAIKQGYDDIIIYGATGGRLDHFLASIRLLELYPDISISIIDKQNKITLLPLGNNVIKENDYKYFSLFSIENTNVTIKNAKYNLDNYLLKTNDPLCVSNEIIDNTTIINDKELIIVYSKDVG